MEGALRPDLPPDLTLIETLLWQDGTAPLWPRHEARLRATAARLGVKVPSLAGAFADLPPTGRHRARLTLNLGGHLSVTHGPLGPNPAVWRVGLARERLEADDPWRGMKTSERAIYDRTRRTMPEELDEMILLNGAGRVADGTITNVFLADGAGLATPPLRSGCLPGVLRADLLANGRAHERDLRADDLRSAPLYLGNALRGLIPANLHLD